MKVHWQELFPDEFAARQAECPVVYLPMGLCEPHGPISAYGLDTIKAEYLCTEAARRFGGIVAPSMGYQIHECGYHAPWLVQELGERNPHLTAVPPFVLLYFFLYQLRAFANAGFRGIVVLTGHSGGNQEDLRLAAEAFSRRVPVKIWAGSDPELVEGLFTGDHAGLYEISQLMHIRPELVDPARLTPEAEGEGRLALGRDAAEASKEQGERIIEASLERLGRVAAAYAGGMETGAGQRDELPPVDYDTVERIWQEVAARRSQWRTASKYPGQPSVPEGSRWKPYEDITRNTFVPQGNETL